MLSIPMLRRPLSEDEGNWYYLSVFWNKGVRLYKDINQMPGYFGVHWIAAILYNALGRPGMSFFNYFKAFWYTCNAMSLYWLVYLFYQSDIIALIASLLLIIVTVTPNTLFFLTYAEHFLILPINMSMIFSYFGFISGNTVFFVFAGLTSGWAVQIRPTALLYVAVSIVIYSLLPNSLLSLTFYMAAVIGLNLLPLIIMSKYPKNAIKRYFFMTFGPVLSLLVIILDKLHFPFYTAVLYHRAFMMKVLRPILKYSTKSIFADNICL